MRFVRVRIVKHIQLDSSVMIIVGLFFPGIEANYKSGFKCFPAYGKFLTKLTLRGRKCVCGFSSDSCFRYVTYPIT